MSSGLSVLPVTSSRLRHLPRPQIVPTAILYRATENSRDAGVTASVAHTRAMTTQSRATAACLAALTLQQTALGPDSVALPEA